MRVKQVICAAGRSGSAGKLLSGVDAKALADLLIDMWPRIEQSAAEGALITVTERSIRVRALPVGGKR